MFRKSLRAAESECQSCKICNANTGISCLKTQVVFGDNLYPSNIVTLFEGQAIQMIQIDFLEKSTNFYKI